MWNALNRIGKESCMTSALRFAKCGDRYFACANLSPAISSNMTLPAIWARGSRTACSKDNILQRNTNSAGHLYGSQFSRQKINIFENSKFWRSFGMDLDTYEHGKCEQSIHSHHCVVMFVAFAFSRVLACPSLVTHETNPAIRVSFSSIFWSKQFECCDYKFLIFHWQAIQTVHVHYHSKRFVHIKFFDS